VPKYTLEIKQSAQRELDALDGPLFTRIDAKILTLADNPRPAGCKKLKGYKDQWRVRVGDWRVVYIIDGAAKFVNITPVGTAARSTSRDISCSPYCSRYLPHLNAKHLQGGDITARASRTGPESPKRPPGRRTGECGARGR
jgi:mRNA interferase RelE/StbE